MKKSSFVLILFFFAMAAGIAIWEFILGNPSNFSDPLTRHKPLAGNFLGMSYVGGPIVSLLICLSIMVFAVVIERTLTLKKAAGNQPIPKFFKNVVDLIREDKYDEAVAACDKQRGSVANVIKAALTRFQEVTSSKANIDKEKQLIEVQRAVEETLMLETPLLEKNLVALSTIASVATMAGLLGTTIGMIRAFSALAQSGAPDAIALSTGISEALINTAGGLFAAILGIVFYNFFTTKVDGFTFQIDEANYNVMQLLKSK